MLSSSCGISPISRYSSLYGFKFISKSLNLPSTRKMATSAAAEAANSVIKLLVTGPRAQIRVGIWLLSCSLLVFLMIQSGGFTRLTRSMLSMADQNHETLQSTDEEWNHESESVKSLEVLRHNHWAEYVHRTMGKGLGIVFGLPFAYFLAKGYITRPLGLRLSLLLALGGAQELFGCLPMVKSGLEEPASEYVQFRASPYGHVMHITSAFILYGGIFWTALSVMVPEPPTMPLQWVRGAAKIRKFVIPVCALVGVTALSGAFVAGNGALHSRAFNTFPKMGNSWIPDDIFNMEPLFRNFFENTSTVQLIHTILATSTLLSIASLWWMSRKIELRPFTETLIDLSLLMASFQGMQ